MDRRLAVLLAVVWTAYAAIGSAIMELSGGDVGKFLKGTALGVVAVVVGVGTVTMLEKLYYLFREH